MKAGLTIGRAGVLIGIGALLAVVLTSAGSAAGSASALRTVSSGVASPSTSTAPGNCSKEAAREVVERLGMSISEPSADPIGKVLCGPFAGPGREAMVVMLRGPGNTGFAEWAVFRWAGGAWQFVMKQPAGASIAAAGSDIRQTLPIYRPSDSRCCPTGGTKTRLWHWNGTRFTVSAWKVVKPGTATAPTGSFKFGFFKTPSGNILCSYAYDKSSAKVECVVKSGLKPPPASRGPGCTPTIVVRLNATGRVQTTGSVCPGEDAPETPYVGSGIAKVLAYGKTWNGGGLRCTSAMEGMTCRNKSGHGFLLNRSRWRMF